jgi:hypothetical protein
VMEVLLQLHMLKHHLKEEKVRLSMILMQQGKT